MKDDLCCSLLFSYISDIWTSGSFSGGDALGHIILLPKTGDLSFPESWCPIQLLFVIYKILTSILASRLGRLAASTPLVSFFQCGFISGRRADEAIMALHLVASFARLRGPSSPPVCALFLDQSKVYDCIDWHWLSAV